MNLLQSLREEVEAEGRKEKELFDKFVCYCTSSTEKLTASIDSGRSRRPLPREGRHRVWLRGHLHFTEVSHTCTIFKPQERAHT